MKLPDDLKVSSQSEKYWIFKGWKSHTFLRICSKYNCSIQKVLKLIKQKGLGLTSRNSLHLLFFRNSLHLIPLIWVKYRLDPLVLPCFAQMIRVPETESLLAPVTVLQHLQCTSPMSDRLQTTQPLFARENTNGVSWTVNSRGWCRHPVSVSTTRIRIKYIRVFNVYAYLTYMH